KIPNPAHIELVDLDGDGMNDLIIAALGSFAPSDDRNGAVVWLRRDADGSFARQMLAEGLGRVSDVQAADFDGDGDLDLVVAEFGWRTVGEIRYMETRTTDYRHPQFVLSSLAPRHGASHVPVADLDGDSQPDFVALISQEHETVVVF